MKAFAEKRSVFYETCAGSPLPQCGGGRRASAGRGGTAAHTGKSVRALHALGASDKRLADAVDVPGADGED